MPVRPMLLHRMALVSSRLFCKNLGNLQEFFGQMVYRPPWPKIARTPMCPEVLVISGDFNFHLDDLRDSDNKKFMDLLETFSLSQHVSSPTLLSGHTLDLIIARSSDDVVLAFAKVTFPTSDHFIIQCAIGFPRPALSCKELTF